MCNTLLPDAAGQNECAPPPSPVSKWWLQEPAVGLQSSFRRTGEEFAFSSTGEVKTLKQASGHAKTAELSLEAGEVLSGSELPDCRLEPKIGDWGDWGLDRSQKLTSRRTFREHGLLSCVACNPSRLRVSDIDNPTRLFRIVRTVMHLMFPRRTSDLLASAGRRMQWNEVKVHSESSGTL